MCFPLGRGKYGKLTGLDLIIDTSGEQAIPESQLRQKIATADPSVAVDKIRTVDQLVGESASSRYFQTALITAFACARAVDRLERIVRSDRLRGRDAPPRDRDSHGCGCDSWAGGWDVRLGRDGQWLDRWLHDWNRLRTQGWSAS